jgi:hypothetical protein
VRFRPQGTPSSASSTANEGSECQTDLGYLGYLTDLETGRRAMCTH